MPERETIFFDTILKAVRRFIIALLRPIKDSLDPKRVKTSAIAFYNVQYTDASSVANLLSTQLHRTGPGEM